MTIRVSVSTGKVGSRCTTEFEIDDDELEGLSDEERDDEIDEMAQQVMFGMIDWNWEIETP
jgi:hypothetical protein